MTSVSVAPMRLALVGTPNVGKSVLFHRLTGAYANVSNYPGTTVDITRGTARAGGRAWDVIDTPGVNSLTPQSEDERITRDILRAEAPNVALQVIDAKNLRRALPLTLELGAFGLPMVVALNMSDEARSRGVDVRADELERILGVPVVSTVATTGEGMEDLFKALLRAKPLSAAPPNNGETQRKATSSERLREFESRRKWVDDTLARVFRQADPPATSLRGHLGNMAMRPWPGTIIAALSLFLTYEFVGVFGAGVAVDFLENVVFGAHINPVVHTAVDALFPWGWTQDILVGPYGVVSMALTYAFALILPIVTTFFIAFGILEDSGYLPRLSVMLDRLFRLIGLNGRAVLPVILGLGCGTMATMTTRILDTKKERFIVTLLLSLSVPCSAQLAVILGMAVGLSWRVMAVWMVTLAAVTLAAGWMSSRWVQGPRVPFVMEIPPLRVPSFGNLWQKTRLRLVWYLKEVVPLFVVGTLILFVFDRMGLLKALENIASPVVQHFLGLPAQATEAFLVGFLRRDYGAAGFYHLQKAGLLSVHQVAVSLVAVSLFMPCSAQWMMVAKERGFKGTLVITVVVMGAALLVSGAVNGLLTLFPWMIS